MCGPGKGKRRPYGMTGSSISCPQMKIAATADIFPRPFRPKTLHWRLLFSRLDGPRSCRLFILKFQNDEPRALTIKVGPAPQIAILIFLGSPRMSDVGGSSGKWGVKLHVARCTLHVARCTFRVSTKVAAQFVIVV